VVASCVNSIGSHNYALVALSVLIAMFASYAAQFAAWTRSTCSTRTWASCATFSQ
jgi:NO-binding membrane sensor protein with MHYT domain